MEHAIMPQTRRKHRRYPVDFAANARVTDQEPDIGLEMLRPAPVRITDLSLGGIHMRADVPYPVDAEVLVDWQVAGKDISTVGRICYRMNEFHDGRARYGCGVKLDSEEFMRRALPMIVGEPDLDA